MLKKELDTYKYSPDTPLKNAIRDLYKNKIDVCLVVDQKDILLGILTLSDIRAAIMRGADPSSPVKTVMNAEYVWADVSLDEAALKKMSNSPNKFGTGALIKIPVLDASKRLCALYVNNDLDKGFSHKTILITGGAGYIGSLVSKKLLDRGYRVIVLDKLTFGMDPVRELLENKNFSLMVGNLNNLGDIMRGVKEADYVIHLAGIVGDPASSLDPVSTLECNHFSTKSLIELSKYYQISRFIFASSCSVYGASSEISDETSPTNPVSLYARTKISSERDLLNNSDGYFHPTILRFSTIYGLSPRMRFDLVANIMSANAFFENAIHVNGGSQWRPMLHVEDAANSCVAALEAPLEKVSGKIFNVGCDTENYTIAEIAKTVGQFAPKAKIKIDENTKDRRDYRVSFKKISEELHFKISKRLDNGIEEMIHAMAQGKYKNFKDPIYSNYLWLKNSTGNSNHNP